MYSFPCVNNLKIKNSRKWSNNDKATKTFYNDNGYKVEQNPYLQKSRKFLPVQNNFLQICKLPTAKRFVTTEPRHKIDLKSDKRIAFWKHIPENRRKSVSEVKTITEDFPGLQKKPSQPFKIRRIPKKVTPKPRKKEIQLSKMPISSRESDKNLKLVQGDIWD